MENLNCGIYKIENKINQKLYIGSAKNLSNRKSKHFSDLKKNNHDNKRLQNSYNKYGEKNFKFEILLYCDKKDLIFYEQRAIDSYDIKKELYNIRLKAENNLGIKWGEKSKERLSEACSGENHRMYGKKHSIETKKKLSESKLGNKNPMFGKKLSKERKDKLIRSLTGRKHTDEARKKMSISRIGDKNPMWKKEVSIETRKKISISGMGRKLKPETIEMLRRKNIKKIKAFLHEENKYIGSYESLVECSVKLGISKSGISNTLRNRQKSHCGYYFEYVKNEN